MPHNCIYYVWGPREVYYTSELQKICPFLCVGISLCDSKKPSLKFRPWRMSSSPPPKYAKNGRHYISELHEKKSC